MDTHREIRLVRRPSGLPVAEDFRIVEARLPPPAAGEVQVRNIWMSLDPYMRGRMNDSRSYVPPFALGATMLGSAVGTVTASNAPGLRPGQLVQSMYGWREAFNAPAETVQGLPDADLPAEAFLGVAGMPGLTAYVGLLRIAELKEGDVAFVSAASGAVGSVVCQIAKLKGAKVIGSAGGAAKTAFLREIGVDETIDYKSEGDLVEALSRAAPDGIDVYFDNVGGAHLEAALEMAKPFSRFALCGSISQYNGEPRTGPANISLAVGRRIQLKGFIVSDHFGLMPSFVGEMAGWIASGRVKWRQTVEHGIERAPAAFNKLFTGDNFGKLLVKL